MYSKVYCTLYNVLYTLTMTHLNALDPFVDKFTKKWAGLPPSATNTVIHLEAALDIPAISSVYIEAHNSSHTRTRLQGDSVINELLDHTLAREATYSRSFQTTTEAENVFRKSLELKTVDGEIPSFTGKKAKQHMSNFNMRIKTSVKNHSSRMPLEM